MSLQRRCDIFKATDNQWYMILGNFEYANDTEDCSVYGPFGSQEATFKELDNHSNPGGMSVDDSGLEPVPKGAKRPNRNWWR